MFMVFLGPYSTLTFLLTPLFYSSFSDTYHNPLYIFQYLLLPLAISSSLLLTPLSFTFLHALLLVCYDATRLSPLLVSHPLVHTLFLSSISTLFLLVTYLFIILLLVFLLLVPLLLLLISYIANSSL